MRQELGDLAVGHAGGGHLGDAALAWGQCLDSGQHGAARSRAARGQLGAGALRECGGAAAVREA
jgi:hypothetical protein